MMFRKLVNECRVEFDLKAEGPLSIRSGENMDIDPTMPDNQFIRSYHNGEKTVVIPGSSIKGVFRSRAEKLLDGSCAVFRSNCSWAGKKGDSIESRYIKNCPACRMFGSLSLKSRVEFKDAFPKDGTELKTTTRHNVGINRVTGAAMKGALFEPEVLEEGVFAVSFVIKNYFLWQLKTLILVIQDINEGLVTFGGVTSRGFGRMSASNVRFIVREYGKSKSGGFYEEKQLSLEEMIEKVRDIRLDDGEFRKVEYDNEYML